MVPGGRAADQEVQSRWDALIYESAESSVELCLINNELIEVYQP